MELNYNIQNEKTMEESITELYENINKILTIHCKLNKMAMNSCHSLGYNGFKRWHRYSNAYKCPKYPKHRKYPSCYSGVIVMSNIL